MPFIVDLIERTDAIGASPIHDLPSLPAWHRGRAVVLGDAAHAVSPSAGQGASMAMEDAIVLAKCLRDLRTPEEAFEEFEALRRGRTERIVATGRRRGSYKALRSRAAVFARDLLMPLAFRLFATEKSMSWIFDHEIRWEERVFRRAA
jgi:2-polyprenyl-6-methoxyphenol hydroxylase-like FAD-dependent oxidoreductase